jgi:hypothetical protein
VSDIERDLAPANESEPDPASASDAEGEHASTSDDAQRDAVDPPTTPTRPAKRSTGGPGCGRIFVIGLILVVLAGAWFAATWRPYPGLPPTGLLTATGKSAALSLESGAVATVPILVSIARSQPKDIAGSTLWARPEVAATLSGPADQGLTMAIESSDGALIVADSSSPARNGPLVWKASCLNPSSCVLEYRVLVGNTTNARVTASLEIGARLEYPVSVPAPDGATMSVALDPPVLASGSMAAATTGESDVRVDPEGAPVVRRVLANVPAGGPDPSVSGLTWLTLDATLTEGDLGPEPSEVSGRANGGPIGQLTIRGLGGDPVVRNLNGESRRLVIGPIASCTFGCRLELTVGFEPLEVRPGANLLLDWQAAVVTVVPGRTVPPTGSLDVRSASVDSSPLVAETAHGELRLGRSKSGAGTSVSLQLDRASLPAGDQFPLTGTATFDFTADVTGSTRRVLIPIGITSSDGMRLPTAGVTASSGSTARLLASPFRSCSQSLQCDENVRIAAQLPPALAAILSDDETVIVRWRLNVSVGRFGPPLAAGEERPALAILTTPAP